MANRTASNTNATPPPHSRTDAQNEFLLESLFETFKLKAADGDTHARQVLHDFRKKVLAVNF